MENRSSSQQAYDLFLEDSDLSLEEIGQLVKRRQRPVSAASVCTYVVKSYKPGDAEVLQRRLKLSKDNVKKTCVVLETTRSLSTEERLRRLRKALGKKCTNYDVALGVVSKLNRDLFTPVLPQAFQRLEVPGDDGRR